MSDDILSDEVLAEIERRAEAATAGPWAVVKGGMPDDWGVTEAKLGTERRGLLRQKPQHQSIAQMLWREDAPFIAHARTDIPALLRHARALQAERDAAKDEVERADAKIVERAAELSSLVVVEGAIEAFRQRVVEAVRVIPDNVCDGHPLSDAGYNLAIDDVAELIESLPATTDEEVD